MRGGGLDDKGRNLYQRQSSAKTRTKVLVHSRRLFATIVRAVEPELCRLRSSLAFRSNQPAHLPLENRTELVRANIPFTLQCGASFNTVPSAVIYIFGKRASSLKETIYMAR